MLQITVPAIELFDERKNEFVKTKEQTLQLEHSLVSLSKWESKWCKPFLYTQDKTYEETLDYIRCMTITQNVDPDVYLRLTGENVKQIDDYINAPMTATTISNREKGKINNEIITAELIYYWMVAFNIPFKCEKWHLNKLITFIRVCEVKSKPPKKQNTSDTILSQAALNEARKKKLNSKG